MFLPVRCAPFLESHGSLISSLPGLPICMRIQMSVVSSYSHPAIASNAALRTVAWLRYAEAHGAGSYVLHAYDAEARIADRHGTAKYVDDLVRRARAMRAGVKALSSALSHVEEVEVAAVLAGL